MMTDKILTCDEFQERLPEILVAGTEGVSLDSDLQTHPDNCENCAALVRDLQYIADSTRGGRVR